MFNTLITLDTFNVISNLLFLLNEVKQHNDTWQMQL